MKKRVLQKDNPSKALPAVAVVSVTRNRCKPLLRVLSQLRELEYPKEMLDIFLVDSASVDDTVERVRQEHPEVNLTESRDNLGIAAGFNTGIKQALNAKRQYKYIWLLDSDVEIEKQTLMPLVVTAEENPEIAVVGSAVYEPENRDQLVTAGLNIDWKTANVAFHIPPDNNVDGVYDVELIPACSSLTRAELYEKQGFWDERLWLYWGDTEWCTRMLRNGCRVCCDAKSRVWHRNWAKIKQDFNFPYVLYGRIRSALLFNLCYNPENSVAGVRYLIKKSYLKAAFENFTLRPNFGRAYVEGIKDFLAGDFSKKDFSSWPMDIESKGIDQICRRLSEKLPKNPRVILNMISDEHQKAEIKRTFQKYFKQIRWEEIHVRTDRDNMNASARMHEYLYFHLPQLLLRLLTIFNRRDLIVSSINVPCLYNIAAARYTMLIDPSGGGYFCRNRPIFGLAKCFATIIKGLKVLYMDLPRALKKCQAIKKGPMDGANRTGS